MKAETTRLALLAQHDRLREGLQNCLVLARASPALDAELDVAIGVLREELTLHNEAETEAIRQLLHGPAAWSSLMIDRMLEEHVAEHAAFWEALSGARELRGARIEELAEEIEAHMAAEERTFLAPITLRDDVLRVRTREETP